MSLPRQDVRLKLDHPVHAKLKVLCAALGTEMSDLVESILVPAIEKKCHECMLVADELNRQGISASRRENPGADGHSRDSWATTTAASL